MQRFLPSLSHSGSLGFVSLAALNYSSAAARFSDLRGYCVGVLKCDWGSSDYFAWECFRVSFFLNYWQQSQPNPPNLWQVLWSWCIFTEQEFHPRQPETHLRVLSPQQAGAWGEAACRAVNISLEDEAWSAALCLGTVLLVFPFTPVPLHLVWLSANLTFFLAKYPLGPKCLFYPCFLLCNVLNFHEIISL